jgi:hypothetical protein
MRSCPYRFCCSSGAAPPSADLTAITQDMPISCRDNTFDTFLDHIVFDARAIAPPQSIKEIAV